MASGHMSEHTLLPLDASIPACVENAHTRNQRLIAVRWRVVHSGVNSLGNLAILAIEFAHALYRT